MYEALLFLRLSLPLSISPSPDFILSNIPTPQVKYWALGNEVYGPWQVEQMTKEDYAKKAYQWAKALKLLDPSIVLILCGETGADDWDRYVLQQCVRVDTHALGGSATASLIDMHSIHTYTASEDHVKNATGEHMFFFLPCHISSLECVCGGGGGG